MKISAKRGMAALYFGLFAALCSACGGGGAAVGTSGDSTHARGETLSTRSVSPQATTRGNVSFAVGFTPKPKPGRIMPKYVSPSTQSLQISTDGGNAVVVNLSPSSPNCSSNPAVPDSYICYGWLTVAPGNHVFQVTAYDLRAAKGNVLSTNSTGTVAVLASEITTVRMVLEGFVQYVTLTLSTSNPPLDKAATIVLTPALEDADHNVIVGAAAFEHPVTLTTTDSANGPLSKTELRSPADEAGITVKYSGANVGSIMYSATATDLSAGQVAGAVLTPTTDTPCPSSPAGTGILYDGDFAQTVYPGFGYVTVSGGQTFAPDWSSTGESIDFVGMYFSAPHGVCCVDLDGTPGPGGIVHTPITTVIGSAYTVSFLLSGNGWCGPTVKNLTETAAGQSGAFTWDISRGNDAQHSVFTPKTWAFTATSTQTKLQLASADYAAGNCGPVVAAIAVTRL
jgi:hypothetical protein